MSFTPLQFAHLSTLLTFFFVKERKLTLLLIFFPWLIYVFLCQSFMTPHVLCQGGGQLYFIFIISPSILFQFHVRICFWTCKIGFDPNSAPEKLATDVCTWGRIEPVASSNLAEIFLHRFAEHHLVGETEFCSVCLSYIQGVFGQGQWGGRVIASNSISVKSESAGEAAVTSYVLLCCSQLGSHYILAKRRGNRKLYILYLFPSPKLQTACIPSLMFCD